MNILKRIQFYLLALSIPVLFLGACNEPSIIGEDLLSDDQASFFFSDTFAIEAKTLNADSVIVYQPGFQRFSYLCGDFLDPLFGKAKAVIYSQMGLSVANPSFLEGVDQGRVVLDKVELVLAVRTDETYGLNLDQPISIGVYELEDELDREETYYAPQSFQTRQLIGDTAIVASEIDDSTQVLRLPLSEAFGQQMLELDPTAYESNDDFFDAFKGIAIVPESETNYMLSFNIDGSFIELSYLQDDTLSSSYNFFFAGNLAKMTTFEHDYTATAVEAALENNVPSDTVSSLYLQGMAGVNLELQLPALEDLQGVEINKAELVLSSELSDIGSFPLIDQLLAYKYDENGGLEQIEDIQFFTNGLDFGRVNAVLTSLRNGFGGVLDDDSNPNSYTLNIAAYLQNVIEGNSDNRIIIGAAFRPETPNRVIISGPGATNAPVELRVTYTKIN